ncbi:hypothetical protein ACFQ08_14250 [Streptosporangium algeriense]|uniref:Transcriptional regulator n=1 Tax=Streptosporangium algeriense TaxID=1682748 RepID=A0ABW3DSM7_9ACTN
MARPEKPIIGDGPVENLARELRRLRELAGSPAPTYAQLAKIAHHSRSVLAEAAAGHRCPTWKVTSDFITACGGASEQEPWPTLWNLAHAAAGQARDSSNRKRAEDLAENKGPAGARQATAVISKSVQGPAQPDPWLAGTPHEYRYQLGLLRAWAGVSLQEIRRRNEADEWGKRWIAYTTLHDALNPRLLRMPPLRIVRAIVMACEADAEQWVGAWRAINMARFTQSTPPPPGLRT